MTGNTQVLDKLSELERDVCVQLLDRPVAAVAVAMRRKRNTLIVCRRRAEQKLSRHLGRPFVFPRQHRTRPITSFSAVPI